MTLKTFKIYRFSTNENNILITSLSLFFLESIKENLKKNLDYFLIKWQFPILDISNREHRKILKPK